ncbi:MAG TPA: hypothetical protein VFE38_05040 [Edaphobacter sp.]|nr:hypothetical protein [Edaphobacter sp.]
MDVSNNGGKDYYGNGVPSTPSIGAQAIASASTSSTLLTFSDSTAADYNAVPSSYQPVSGVTITWDGGGATTHRYGTHTYDGYQDHRSMLARRQSILVQLQGVAACHPYIGLQAASRELGVLPASVNTTKTRGIRSHPKYGLGFMEKAEFSARF